MMGTSYVWKGVFLCSILSLLPAGLPAQETQETPPAPQPAESTELVFEREVFSYPAYERRNPFLPLVGAEDGGPRFEDLALLGILYSPNSDRSVATFGMKGAGGSESGTALPGSFRVRRGNTLGNVRVLEIQQTSVVVEVVEFGLTEQRVIELQRPGQGGSS